MLLVVFLMGVVCGYIITYTIFVKPLTKLNKELLDFIDKWEIDSWEKINKK